MPKHTAGAPSQSEADNPGDFYRERPAPRRDQDGRFIVDWSELSRIARLWDASGVFPEEEYQAYCHRIGNTPTAGVWGQS
jgi:hypothetical protein